MISAFLNVEVHYKSTAHLFIEILNYYGSEFNPNTMTIVQNCIAISPVDLMYGPARLIESSGLFVSDPHRPELNAASSVTRFNEIQERFGLTHKKLLQLLNEYNKSDPVSILDFAFKEV